MAGHAPRTATITATLALLMCSVAPAALAQPTATAASQPVGISQEQLLALVGRMDALEQRVGDPLQSGRRVPERDLGVAVEVAADVGHDVEVVVLA